MMGWRKVGMNGTRNSNLLGKITILLIICCCSLPAQAKYGGGTGEPNDPYQIWDANHMNAIGADPCDWDKHFILMADIDLSAYTGTSFNIIGTGHFEYSPTMTYWFVGAPFTGVFDGNGHSISNFTYEYSGDEFVGLFGCVDGESAQIKNLGLRDVDIYAHFGDRVGPLVGLLFNGTVINCYTQGGSVSGDYRVGGLIGQSDEPASICNCYTDVNVSSNDNIGGLVGTNLGTITDCYSTGEVSGIYYVGGLAGSNGGTVSNCYSFGLVSGGYAVGGMVGDNGGIINNCYTNGSISGENGVGGLVGDNGGIITDCYSTGSVSGNSGIGGLVGYTWFGIITNCYAACDVEGTEIVGGLVGYNSRNVVNCYAIGSVSGTINVGGLVGRNGDERYSGTITNCYSAAPVMGTTNVGGLVGLNEDGTVTFSFWDVNTSGLDYSDGGVGKTTAEMQTMSTFTDAGWDFAGEYENGPSDDWAEPLSGGYMILWWQLSPLPELPTFSGGTGEPDDPYLILTAAELNHIGHNPRLMSRHFKLIDDIDLTGTDFFIIGKRECPFTGNFDGNGKTISNFIYRRTNQDETGFFTCVDNMQSQIKDLYLKDSCVEATNTDYVGALCGTLTAGTITGCHIEACSVLGKRYIGGLVGFNIDGTISNCTSSGSVSGGGMGSFLGSGYVGGLVGSNYGVIRNCASHSSVISGSDDHVGGLVGNNGGFGCKPIPWGCGDYPGTISNSYSTGSVSGDRWIGGLVGMNWDSTITNCYSAGSVSGNSNVGGLVGYDYSQSIAYRNRKRSRSKCNR
jgi:hypothetical protein